MIPVKKIDEASCLLYIWATPAASSNRLGEIVLDNDDIPYLKTYVTTPPEKGLANKSIIKLLSKRLGISKSLFDLTQGQTDRKKVFTVQSSFENLESAFKIATGSLF